MNLRIVSITGSLGFLFITYHPLVFDGCPGIKSLTFLEYPAQGMRKLRVIQKLEVVNCQHQ